MIETYKAFEEPFNLIIIFLNFGLKFEVFNKGQTFSVGIRMGQNIKF